MTATGGVYLPEFGDQTLVSQFTDELGDGGYAQIEFLGQFSNCIVARVDEMGDDVLFYLNIQ